MINFPEIEKKITKYWQKNKIFEKTLKQRKNCPIFSFYDGPPFATGLPHYGHILASTIKDVIPRYWTMKGYYVPRRWGWDCHGLPIENIIEEKLKISGKKQIEEIGIEKFNKSCREAVLTYAKEWGKMVERIGRFVDFENSYKTMDNDYIESVWWALKEIWKKGLIYEGRKVLLYCPRCECPISSFEVAMDNSYQEVTEKSIIVKFRVKNRDKNLFLLAWTTTPWTLPGNMALAINKDFDYLLVEQNQELYLIAESRKKILEGEFKVLKKYKGKDLAGIQYEPLYNIEEAKENKNKYQVFSADFVSSDEGTGIVHSAPVYGEDDYQLGIKFDLPIIPLLDNKGIFNEKAPIIIQGKKFKESESIIKDDLFKRGLIYKEEQTTHSYPFCWRCNSVLFYSAIPAWFINIQKIKKELIRLNEDINWYPAHLKYGRFLKGIESAPDWTISRNRYWASPLPIWKCGKCQHQLFIGSLKELKQNQVGNLKIKDLHRPYIDRIKIKCPKCHHLMKRITEVVDCWVESASMLFAEIHYPFKNRNNFKKRFPAHFIAEYIPQTRAWFYVMHVISTILFNKPAFKNAVGTGTILNEKGEKMSKSKRNFPDPWEMIERYGVDSLRFYLMSSSVMKGEDLFFSEKELREIYQKNVLLTLNILSFYKDYQPLGKQNFSTKSKHILDIWILSRLNYLIKETTNKIDNYDVVLATKEIKAFISDFSLWYLRRSRERFKQGDKQGIKVFGYVLFQLAIIIAPFMPFLAEHIYQAIGGKKKSVHLEDWPKVNKKLINEKLNQKMEKVREIVTLALAERAKVEIKVRQPLASLKIKNQKSKIKNKELLDLIKDEVNVKKIVFDPKIKNEIELDTKITAELREEGMIRDIIREIQGMRKKAGLKPKDKILIQYLGTPELNKILEKNKKIILIETKAQSFSLKDREKKFIVESEITIDGQALQLFI